MRIIVIPAALLASVPAYSENTFKIVTDEMTDAKRGIAVINSGGNISPVVKCDSNGPGQLYISFISQKYLGKTISRYRSSTRSVKFRFDGGEAYDIEAYYDGRTATILNVE